MHKHRPRLYVWVAISHCHAAVYILCRRYHYMWVSPLLNITIYLVFIGYCTNLDEYLRRLSKPATFRPHGELLHVYQHQDNTYEIYKVEYRISVMQLLILYCSISPVTNLVRY